jgi:hypothetical protein
MPNWKELLDEAKATGSPFDVIRRKYLAKLSELTQRNTIAYYSGWLQKPLAPGLGISDEDKNGFMSTINGLDRTKGLDLLLHTPGGETAAVESLVDYLHRMFPNDIRVIVPQIAMSGGTMIACAANIILMGKQSSLGPIDPIFNGVPAHGVIEEFERARTEIKSDPSKIPVWQPILAKYPPAFVGECDKAIQWSETLVDCWLRARMLDGDAEADKKCQSIIHELGDHALTLSHARHLSSDKCTDIGLKIELLEDTPNLQDAVLSVHHAFMITLSQTAAFKIIENQMGIAFIKAISTALIEAQ